VDELLVQATAVDLEEVLASPSKRADGHVGEMRGDPNMYLGRKGKEDQHLQHRCGGRLVAVQIL
jgi:hypothetical protein